MTTTRPPTRNRLATVALLAALVAATVGPGAAGGSATAPAADVADVVELLPLSGDGMRIVDSAGRDVLLRGANVNSLGEYWAGVPGLGPTIPMTDDDWAEFAARGLNTVRLIVTWSLIEPERGVIDQAYLDKVDATVRAAARHGIYSVIDMHQDAYSAFIFTTPAEAAACPAGTGPAKGWDGAPEWATLTDGLSTCTPGERNASPAVNRAWNNFWDDRDGIRGRFVETWRAVAARFAGRPEVAGYDLLNEPEVSRPAAELQPIYEDFLADVITAIREAEAAAPFEHLQFIEPAIPAGDQSRGIVIPNPSSTGVSLRNVVAAAHNYAESIGVGGLDLTIEQLNGFIRATAAQLGVPVWIGEYGFWDTEPETLAKARRYAAEEDRTLQGGAWWQWRQSCGDPHAVSWDGTAWVPGTGVSTHLNLTGCPDDTDLGPNEDFLTILGRGYPRAVPGRLARLTSDSDTGLLLVEATAGDADAGGQLVVWTPTAAGDDHRVWTRGLADVTEHTVPGGRLVTATVVAAGPYALAVGPTDPLPPESTTTTTTPGSTPPPAVPVQAPAAFTG